MFQVPTIKRGMKSRVEKIRYDGQIRFFAKLISKTIFKMSLVEIYKLHFSAHIVSPSRARPKMIIITKPADDLATSGAKPSTAMVCVKYNKDIRLFIGVES